MSWDHVGTDSQGLTSVRRASICLQREDDGDFLSSDKAIRFFFAWRWRWDTWKDHPREISSWLDVVTNAVVDVNK